MADWLKKYMQIEYLEKTLAEKKLHLGNPQSWPDKNDSEVIEIYRKKKNLGNVRATCLTEAPDRNHFWEIFGKCELGVCLWFDKSELVKDIDNDPCLRGDLVTYYTPNKLIKKCNFSDLPFAKRAQYTDEQEYRVLRECELPSDGKNRGITFSPQSLKRIYFNSWLDSTAYRMEKRKIEQLNSLTYGHIKIQQNRTLRLSKWIDAAKKVK